MWILDAISRVPLKRLFLLLSTSLGAVFLLLAHLFYIRALIHPVTYALLATVLYLAHRARTPLWKACLFPPLAYALAYAMVPQYLMLFAAALTLACGWLLFRDNFRMWKWGASAVLFFLSLMIVAVWEQLGFVQSLIPVFWTPLVCGLIFSFCAGFSFLPYLIQKDRVREAADSCAWTPRSEPEALVRQAIELYGAVRRQLDGEPKLQEELETLCEKVILQCGQLQRVSAELARTKYEDLQSQAETLKAKAQSVDDAPAKRQYEQAFANKEKQRKQYESLQNKAERLRAQVLQYLTGLENMRFAYTNREFRTAGDGRESIEFFMNLARAENAYDTSEAYGDLL